MTPHPGPTPRRLDSDSDSESEFAQNPFAFGISRRFLFPFTLSAAMSTVSDHSPWLYSSRDPLATLGVSLTALLSVASPPPTEPPVVPITAHESDVSSATGTARLEFHSGMTYEGDVVLGVREGAGRLTLADGTRVTGGFTDGEPSGNGVIQWPDGSTYEGGLERGLRHGRGVMRHAPTGAVFDGAWSHGARHGVGTLRYADGATYVGTWADDLRAGTGVLTYANGNSYVGGWARDKKHGVGRFCWLVGPHAGEEIVGQWCDNLPHGEGVHTWYELGADAAAVAHAGGDPFRSAAVRQRFRGSFRAGLRHGVGAITYGAGAAYVGGWWENVKHGFGVWVATDGAVLDAAFENDSPVTSLAALIASGQVLVTPAPLTASTPSVTDGSPVAPSTAARLPPGVTPPPSAPRRAIACEAPFTFDLSAFAPSDDRLVAWAHATSAAAAAAQLPFSLVGGGSAAGPVGSRALASRLRAQCEERLNGVLLRWAARFTSWYEAYSRMPLQSARVGEAFATPPSPASAAQVYPTALGSYAAALAASPGVGASGAGVSTKPTRGAPSTVLRLSQLWRFVRDVGLLAPPALTLASVGETLGRIRTVHARVRIEAAGRLLALATVVGADAAPRPRSGSPAPSPNAAADSSVGGNVSEDTAIGMSATADATLAAGGIVVDTLRTLRAQTGYAPDAPPELLLALKRSVGVGIPTDASGCLLAEPPARAPLAALHDPNAPVLLREFVEVIVRLILDKARLDVAAPTPTPTPTHASSQHAASVGFPASPSKANDGDSSPGFSTLQSPPRLLALGAAASSGASMYESSKGGTALTTTLAALLPQRAAVGVIPVRAWGSSGLLSGGNGAEALASRPVGAGAYRARIGEHPPSLFTTSNVAMLTAPEDGAARVALVSGDPDGPALVLEAALLRTLAPRALAPPPPVILAAPAAAAPGAPPLVVTTAMIASVRAAAAGGGSARSVALTDSLDGPPTSSRMSAAFSVRTSRTLGGTGGPRRVKMDPDVAAGAAAAAAAPQPLASTDSLRLALLPGLLPDDLTPAALAAAYNGGGTLKPRRGVVAFNDSLNMSANVSAEVSISSQMMPPSRGDETRSGRVVRELSPRPATNTLAVALAGPLRAPLTAVLTALSTASSPVAISRAPSGVLREGLAAVSAALSLLPIPPRGDFLPADASSPNEAFMVNVPPSADGPVTVRALLSAAASAGLLECAPEDIPVDLLNAFVTPPPPSQPPQPKPVAEPVAPPTPSKAATPSKKGAPPTPAPVAAPAAPVEAPKPSRVQPSPAALAAADASPALARLHEALAAALRAMPVLSSDLIAAIAASATSAVPVVPAVLALAPRSLADDAGAAAAATDAAPGVRAAGKLGALSPPPPDHDMVSSAPPRAQPPAVDEVRVALTSLARHTPVSPRAMHELLPLLLTGPEPAEALVRIASAAGVIWAARAASLTDALAGIAAASAAADSALAVEFPRSGTPMASPPGSRRSSIAPGTEIPADALPTARAIAAAAVARAIAAVRIAATQGLVDAAAPVTVVIASAAPLPPLSGGTPTGSRRGSVATTVSSSAWTYTGPGAPVPRAQTLSICASPEPAAAALATLQQIIEAFEFVCAHGTVDLPVLDGVEAARQMEAAVAAPFSEHESTHEE